MSPAITPPDRYMTRASRQLPVQTCKNGRSVLIAEYIAASVELTANSDIAMTPISQTKLVKSCRSRTISVGPNISETAFDAAKTATVAINTSMSTVLDLIAT